MQRAAAQAPRGLSTAIATGASLLAGDASKPLPREIEPDLEPRLGSLTLRTTDTEFTPTRKTTLCERAGGRSCCEAAWPFERSRAVPPTNATSISLSDRKIHEMYRK